MPKTIIITGAGSGLGAASARLLAGQGHEVVLVGRSAGNVRAVADGLGCAWHTADFTRLDEVRALAATLDARYPRIDALANNAGALRRERTETVDGFEETLQVNYLAPFLLTHLLLGKLTESRATVVQTSSNAAKLNGRVDLDDFGNTVRYTPTRAYGTAKLQLILFTRELHTRFHDRGLTAAAFHPGGVRSNFAQDTTSPVRYVFGSPLLRRLILRPADVAAHQLARFVTTEPGSGWEAGAYHENGKVRRSHAQAADPVLAARLWERTEEVLGLR
ncbi:SDR family NAD(P)-dependent oxidoreductase [Pseudosporangium ferrugineum]|uniref:Short-subunit dehydrogenase n=1 Tax=Pseudosporangium ferrugineum TaxID=439699 RepID=A0A2T0RXI5_9ACTN|nr:SDR family NAD(P)-dependent oxidoreductase [Pseudosporangium ferrugineum]PRY25842.1 short-subunit dehydrogenase [Pseudosporangium ferrugineum]